MWKSIFIFFGATSILSWHTCHSQQTTFSVKGFIKGQQTGVVSLSYYNKERVWTIDSCALQQGSFYFTGTISEPTIASLRGDVQSRADDDPNAVSIYIEPSVMTIKLERNYFKEMRMTGSKSQREYEGLQDKIARIKGQGEVFFDTLMETAAHFIATHPSSYVSAFELLLFTQQLPLDTVNVLYHQLSPAVQQSQYGKEIYPLLTQMLGSLPGRKAANFITTDINHQSIDLSTFSGKYILLDFWASWCVPCRAGAPHLRMQYSKYHPFGLEIIAVADDDDHPDAWKEAVQKDSVYIWHNILRGQQQTPPGNSNGLVSINDKYGIKVLPSKILIDKNGVIIGRYEGSDAEPALDKKLKELFGQ
jgi:thiol-disulfide isomerase/thioredoxin